MNKAVNITKRIKVPLLGKGKGKQGYRFCAAVWSDKRRLKPNVVVVNGKPELHSEGCYYVSYYSGKTLKREPCTSPMHAVERMVALKAKMAAVNQGFEINDPSDREAPKSGHDLIQTAAAWIKIKTMQNPKSETTRSVAGGINLFLEFMAPRPHKTIEEIDRNDMLDFVTFMRNRVLKHRGKKGKHTHTGKKGMAASTQLNRFVVVKTFLRKNGWVDCTEKGKGGDTPKFTLPMVEIFEPEELKRFFDACNTDYETTLFKLLLTTGIRHKEAKYLTWNNISFAQQTLAIRAHPEFNWTPKTHEEREIPLLPEMVELLKKWKEQTKANCNLVFPSRICRPNSQFLTHCKAIAVRAGLKVSKEKDYFIHKFRATFATMALDNNTLVTVQFYMGHKDLASTQRYLKPNRSKDARPKLALSFSGVF